MHTLHSCTLSNRARVQGMHGANHLSEADEHNVSSRCTIAHDTVVCHTATINPEAVPSALRDAEITAMREIP